MTRTAVTWVVGAGGLLGRHVVDRLRRCGGEVVTTAVPWSDTDAVGPALRAGLAELLAHAGGGPWNIAWCAGAGVVATAPEALRTEQAVFAGFVADVRTAGAGTDGAFFLASSAGGVYAGSPGPPPYTEDSEPGPLAPYGTVKLAMEAELVRLSRDTGTPVFIGRIANLYGPGQNLAKPQGLVTLLCKASYTGQPLSIYVPLDTLRDYLLVGDCADMIVHGLADLRRVAAADPVAQKILASGRGVSIGGLIAEVTRVFRRRPRIILGSSPLASVQARDLRLRSVRWPELDGYARTTLAAGISATARDVDRRLRAEGHASAR